MELYVKNVIGLFAIGLNYKNTIIHFFVFDRKEWIWGVEESWYDGPIKYFGLGPFIQINWFSN